MSVKKVIVVIKGGIGNQLFCYAAAKRLAIKNNAMLIIDHFTGFERDYLYKRKYQLNHFLINERLANKSERLYPLSRYRRKILKLLNRLLPFSKRNYIVQLSNDFDARILNYKVRRKVIVDGYWQSELYFKDIENIIRENLTIIPPKDSLNITYSEKITNTNAVCIHVRWFNPPDKVDEEKSDNMKRDYYLKGIEIIKKNIADPFFYIFSDYPDETLKFLELSDHESIILNINKGDDLAYADLWLMTLCKHFIISNSTFSWWGAWLSNYSNKIVIAPKEKKGSISAWGFKGLIPNDWITI